MHPALTSTIPKARCQAPASRQLRAHTRALRHLSSMGSPVLRQRALGLKASLAGGGGWQGDGLLRTPLLRGTRQVSEAWTHPDSLQPSTVGRGVGLSAHLNAATADSLHQGRGTTPQAVLAHHPPPGLPEAPTATLHWLDKAPQRAGPPPPQTPTPLGTALLAGCHEHTPLTDRGSERLRHLAQATQQSWISKCGRQRKRKRWGRGARPQGQAQDGLWLDKGPPWRARLGRWADAPWFWTGPVYGAGGGSKSQYWAVAWHPGGRGGPGTEGGAVLQPTPEPGTRQGQRLARSTWKRGSGVNTRGRVRPSSETGHGGRGAAWRWACKTTDRPAPAPG